MSTHRENGENRTSTSRLVDSVDQMFRLPLEMTGATWDLFMEGMENMTGNRSWRRRRTTTGSSSEERSSTTSTTSAAGESDQDLSGDDLKYVVWSIVFTKPDYECVLEPQHQELVNYSTDGASFAGLKIAKFLEKARHGHMPKPEDWGTDYPPIVATPSGRKRDEATTPEHEQAHERGWRIPADDHKYIKFLYRVDRRLPKQEEEIERVTIERGRTTKVY